MNWDIQSAQESVQEFWSKYKWWIGLALLILVVLAVVITLIVVFVNKTKARPPATIDCKPLLSQINQSTSITCSEEVVSWGYKVDVLDNTGKNTNFGYVMLNTTGTTGNQYQLIPSSNTEEALVTMKESTPVTELFSWNFTSTTTFTPCDTTAFDEYSLDASWWQQVQNYQQIYTQYNIKKTKPGSTFTASSVKVDIFNSDVTITYTGPSIAGLPNGTQLATMHHPFLDTSSISALLGWKINYTVDNLQPQFVDTWFLACIACLIIIHRRQQIDKQKSSKKS